MTPTTSERLRSLARRNEFTVREPGVHLESADVLRAAADQLEAVRSWLDGQNSAEWDTVDLDALDAILTADTAPQGKRDD